MSTPESDIKYGSMDEMTASFEDEINGKVRPSEKEGGDESESTSQTTSAATDDVAVEVARQDSKSGGLRRFLRFTVSNPKAFAFWSTLYLLMKVSSGLYTGAAINTIEKQFKLSSTQSGAIMMLGDAMDLALVLFVTYFGQSRHRPRLIAFGTLISGLGMLLCAVPHLSLEPYTDIPAGCNQTQATGELCSAEKTVEDPCEVDFQQPAVNPVVWLILGQIVVGIGNVPIKPLGTTCIDDAVGKHSTPLYIAFLFIGASAGSMFGMMLATGTLSIFVDFDRVAHEDQPTFDVNDPRFIGAWWLGYVVIGCAILLISVPFFFFPRHLPKTKERMKEEAEQKAVLEKLKEQETSEGVTNQKSMSLEKEKEEPFSIKLIRGLKEMYYSYKKLLLNVALILLCLSSAAASAVNAGNASFGFKYYSKILQVPDSISPIFSLAVVPFLIGGNIIGGILIRRNKWSPKKCALLIAFGEFASVVCAPVFLTVGCSTVTIAGVSAPYNPPAVYDGVPLPTNLPTPLPNSAEQALSPCNMNCTCVALNYDPVCGTDDLTYVSSCYAGCEVVAENNSVKSFSDCQCIDNVSPTAVDGQCDNFCAPWKIPVVLLASIIEYFLGALGATALPLITLRIVDVEMRATALGLQTIALNLLGYFIAPVYFGALVNLSCIFWGYDNGQRGACWVYSNELFRYTFQGTIAMLKLISTLLLVGVVILLREPKEEGYKEEETDVTPRTPSFKED